MRSTHVAVADGNGSSYINPGEPDRDPDLDREPAKLSPAWHEGVPDTPDENDLQ